LVPKPCSRVAVHIGSNGAVIGVDGKPSLSHSHSHSHSHSLALTLSQTLAHTLSLTDTLMSDIGSNGAVIGVDGQLHTLTH